MFLLVFMYRKKYIKNCIKLLEFVLNTIFVFSKYFKRFSLIYKNGKSESQNSLKLLKNQLHCFNNFFKKLSGTYKNGKCEPQNSLKLLKKSLDLF